ncbi:MAG: chemotaxis protein CheB, partial [Candidatus Xenobia bacterium]
MCPRIVVIGASMGGSRALRVVLAGLPRDFPAAVAIVQHRGVAMGGEVTAGLQPHSLMPVEEARDKDALVAGCVRVAPPDYHLLVDREGFALSTEGPVQFARPSVDVLFDSAAAVLGPLVVAVVLSGYNRDGAEGAARVKARGGVVIVQ